MQRFLSFVRKHHALLVIATPIALLLLIGFALLPVYQYQINPDATSYISLAHKYADGSIREAVNGYWGPALSWLMAPVIKIGVQNDIVLAKLLALATSAAILFLIHRLFNLLAVATRFRWFFFVPAIPVLLNWSLAQAITGDLLFAGACIFLVVQGVAFLRNPSSVRASILLGVAGALLYFTKPLGFYYTVASFAILAGMLWLNQGRKRGDVPSIAKRLLPGVAAFALIAAPWVAALSLKYDQPTIATSFSLNHALVSPTYRGTDANPLANHITVPENETAISSWEDPSGYYLPDWSMFDSKDTFFYGLGLIIANIYTAIALFNEVTIAGGAIVLGLLLFCIARVVRKGWKFGAEEYILLSALLVVAAYVSILVLDRYIYASLLLIPALGLAVAIPTARKLLNRPLALCLLVLLTLGTLYPSVSDLYRLRSIDKNSFLAAKAFDRAVENNDRIVSNQLSGLYVSYHLGSQFYGIVSPATARQDALQRLKEYNIDYYVYYGDIKSAPDYLRDYKKVASADATTHLIKVQ